MSYQVATKSFWFINGLRPDFSHTNALMHVGKAILTTGLKTCKNFFKLEVKNLGKMFKINTIFLKIDISL